jgi:hypothetical protein
MSKVTQFVGERMRSGKHVALAYVVIAGENRALPLFIVRVV